MDRTPEWKPGKGLSQPLGRSLPLNPPQEKKRTTEKKKGPPKRLRCHPHLIQIPPLHMPSGVRTKKQHFQTLPRQNPLMWDRLHTTLHGIPAASALAPLEFFKKVLVFLCHHVTIPIHRPKSPVTAPSTAFPIPVIFRGLVPSPSHPQSRLLLSAIQRLTAIQVHHQ